MLGGKIKVPNARDLCFMYLSIAGALLSTVLFSQGTKEEVPFSTHNERLFLKRVQTNVSGIAKTDSVCIGLWIWKQTSVTVTWKQKIIIKKCQASKGQLICGCLQFCSSPKHRHSKGRWNGHPSREQVHLCFMLSKKALDLLHYNVESSPLLWTVLAQSLPPTEDSGTEFHWPSSSSCSMLLGAILEPLLQNTVANCYSQQPVLEQASWRRGRIRVCAELGKPYRDREKVGGVGLAATF